MRSNEDGQRAVYDAMGDRLFEHVSRLHGPRPWGRVLDAGTGRHSLRWLTSLSTSAWIAVTAESQRAVSLERELHRQMRPADRIVQGDWKDQQLLHGEVFDTVLVDYLLGALDGFAPYFQTRLFARLRPHVRGELYAIGLEPYTDTTESPAGELVREIARLRDACILLAGDRCFREYPMAWSIAQLEASGFVIDDAATFPIVYGERFVRQQLAICEQKLPRVRGPGLASALSASVEQLRARALELVRTEGGLRYGEDYVIRAVPRQ